MAEVYPYVEHFLLHYVFKNKILGGRFELCEMKVQEKPLCSEFSHQFLLMIHTTSWSRTKLEHYMAMN